MNNFFDVIKLPNRVGLGDTLISRSGKIYRVSGSGKTKEGEYVKTLTQINTDGVPEVFEDVCVEKLSGAISDGKLSYYYFR